MKKNSYVYIYIYIYYMYNIWFYMFSSLFT
ncbi:hypothetical protein PFUGPA_03304 [Plasmodium falciparum Palo Alto/Uganda]|uniref:Uncharacterized protein n=1 Tax=Plasmodium falciparum (isolate Palo Alto / Uganda) TaxID=57270 RepID=W4IXI8_PLAFP|nr:hypothetical protein PFUGPA_03304 [Plasmodium falciparum Palo Alto/Uganda]